jgi:hypothetical protein
MGHTTRLALLTTLALAIAGAAAAGPKCTSEPKSKWLSEADMRAKIDKLGYTRIKTFQVTGSCYEIYGWTKDGKKAEVYFNPVTGEIVKGEVE